GPVDPADVFRVLGIMAALARLAGEGQGLVAKTLRGRVEELALKVQPLDRVVIRRLRSAVTAPAVGPVVVARQPDQRSLERVEVRERGGVEAVVARAVAAGLQVAVEDGEGDMAVVDIGQQVGILRPAERAVRHVTEQADRVARRATALAGRGWRGPGGGPGRGDGPNRRGGDGGGRDERGDETAVAKHAEGHVETPLVVSRTRGCRARP